MVIHLPDCRCSGEKKQGVREDEKAERLCLDGVLELAKQVTFS